MTEPTQPSPTQPSPTQPSPKPRKAKAPAQAQPSATQSYQSAYERLSAIACELESGTTDLDRALPLLSEAQAAYTVCQERLAKLEALLAQGGVVEALDAPPTPDEDEDDDSD